MNKPDKAGEPSMEDILASIRKIIAEEPIGSRPDADTELSAEAARTTSGAALSVSGPTAFPNGEPQQENDGEMTLSVPSRDESSSAPAAGIQPLAASPLTASPSPTRGVGLGITSDDDMPTPPVRSGRLADALKATTSHDAPSQSPAFDDDLGDLLQDAAEPSSDPAPAQSRATPEAQDNYFTASPQPPERLRPRGFGSPLSKLVAEVSAADEDDSDEMIAARVDAALESSGQSASADPSGSDTLARDFDLSGPPPSDDLSSTHGPEANSTETPVVAHAADVAARMSHGFGRQQEPTSYADVAVPSGSPADIEAATSDRSADKVANPKPASDGPVVIAAMPAATPDTAAAALTRDPSALRNTENLDVDLGRDAPSVETADVDVTTPTASDPEPLMSAEANGHTFQGHSDDGARINGAAMADPHTTNMGAVQMSQAAAAASGMQSASATSLEAPLNGSTDPAVQTLEDTVADLLRPMLRQWLAEHMPRIVEKALRVELAETLSTLDEDDPGASQQ